MEAQNVFSTAYSTFCTSILKASSLKNKQQQSNQLVSILNQIQDALLLSRTIHANEFVGLATMIRASPISNKHIHKTVDDCIARCLSKANSQGNAPQTDSSLPSTMALMPTFLSMLPRTSSSSTTSTVSSREVKPEVHCSSQPDAFTQYPETSPSYRTFVESIKEAEQIQKKVKRLDRIVGLLNELTAAISKNDKTCNLSPAEFVELATMLANAAQSNEIRLTIEECVAKCLNKLTASPTLVPRAETPKTPDWYLNDQESPDVTCTTSSEGEPRRSGRARSQTEFYSPDSSSPQIGRKRYGDSLELNSPKRARIDSPERSVDGLSDIDSSDEENDDDHLVNSPRVLAATLCHGFAYEFPWPPTEEALAGRVFEVLFGAIHPIVEKHPHYTIPGNQHHLTTAIVGSQAVRNKIAALIFWRYDELCRTDPALAAVFKDTIMNLQPPLEQQNKTLLLSVDQPASLEWFRQLANQINITKSEYAVVFQVFQDITERSLLHLSKQDAEDEADQLSNEEKEALKNFSNARMHRYLDDYHALVADNYFPISTFLRWVERNEKLNAFNWAVYRLQYLLNEDSRVSEDAATLSQISDWLTARMPPSQLYA